MNKTAVKVIKRTKAGVTTGGGEGAHNSRQPKLPTAAAAAAFGQEKIERRRERRKVADTISKWIDERRANNRAEENSAIQRIFGTEPVSSKTAGAREFVR